MSRDWWIYLDHMIDCCEKITRYIGSSNRDEFLTNELVYDAVLRNLETLGEATKHVPTEVKARMPAVAWREIAGMRDWLAHGYLTIRADVIWNAIRVEVPLLWETLQVFQENETKLG